MKLKNVRILRIVGATLVLAAMALPVSVAMAQSEWQTSKSLTTTFGGG
jgi:hypothetical protein